VHTKTFEESFLARPDHDVAAGRLDPIACVRPDSMSLESWRTTSTSARGQERNFFFFLQRSLHARCPLRAQIRQEGFQKSGDDRFERGPRRAHPRNPNVAGLTTRRGSCTQKDSQNLLFRYLIHDVAAAAPSRLLLSVADSMSFLGS
jgi:hypothetical protein